MIGKTVSHYTILEKLGEGGMGIVFKAEDTKLKRTVALKFLPPGLTRNPEAKERFVVEAQAAAALNHPNIVTVHEIDEYDQQVYIAIEYIQGETLKEKIDSGPVKIDEALKIAIQAAEGLQAAHEKGILHRDIKSANIMVNEKGQVKIMDFGLAKLKGQTQITKEGSTLGTAAYMSPEQARGADVDHRTDIWSLGVVLYEMITGRLPFKGEYEQAVIYSIMNEDPEPPTVLRTDIPKEFERIVNKALAKDPSDRYQHVDDMAADLNKLKKDSETGMSVIEGTVKTGTLRSPMKRFAGGAVVILLVILAGFLYLSRKQSPVPPGGETGEEQKITQRKKIVVFPFENLGPPEDKYFAAGITDEITSRLAAVSGLGVISRTSAVQYDRKGKTLIQIGADLGVAYVLDGTIRWDRGGGGKSRVNGQPGHRVNGRPGHRVRVTPRLIRVSDDTSLWSERYDRVIDDIFEVQTEIAKHVIRHLDITLPASEQRILENRPTKNLEAYNAYLRGITYLEQPGYEQENFQMAEHMFKRAVELDPDFAKAHALHSLVSSLMYVTGYDHTEERMAKAKRSVDRVLELQPEMPLAHMALGYYHYLCHNAHDRALEEFLIAKKGLPNEKMVLEGIFRIQRSRGRFDEAIDNLKTAIDLNPRNANYYYELGLTCMVSRKYSQAEKYLDRSISLAPDQVLAYGMKAFNYYRWKGDLEKARSALEKIPRQNEESSMFFWCIQELYEKKYQAALARLSSLSNDIIESGDSFIPKSQMEGYIYFGLKKPELAFASFDSARTLLEKELKERPDDFRVHSSLGIVYAVLGRKEEAVREGKRAVELYPVSKDALWGPTYVRSLAFIYVIVGEYDLAVEKLAYLLSIPSGVSVPMLQLESTWDPLRKLPKFQQLLQKYAPDTEEVE
jgi:TolB-like protein/Flp pilus assembly protein TadD